MHMEQVYKYDKIKGTRCLLLLEKGIIQSF